MLEIERDLSSPDQHTRSSAMEDLSLLVKRDRSVHGAALVLLRAALEAPTDIWMTTSALRGLELVAGKDEARATAATLIAHPRAELVASVVLGLGDRAYLPVLLEALVRRPERTVREAALRTLGRLRDPSVLPVIVDALAVAELRPHAVEALADLGDVRAIAHLEQLRADRTDAWPEDNHGPMLRVCDLATAAIARLRSQAERPAS
jgi:HEAT repeat protein